MDLYGRRNGTPGSHKRRVVDISTVYNSRTIKNMLPEDIEKIQKYNVPLEYYTKGVAILGPMNKSSIGKFANVNTTIYFHDLPLPPSMFTEMIVDRCTGTSKQDFREIIDAPPGWGKSYSGLYGCGRYAIEAADRHGQDPKDYFSIENCVLLQDTERVLSLMDELDKHQAVFIDDAGVAAGNRDYATQSNKNLSVIMQTCRTKRWYVVFTAPMNKHLDLSIRELVYCKGKIYKSCHDAGFNILKQKSIHMRERGGKFKEYNPNFIFNDVKFDLYAYFTPEFLDPYKGIIELYDTARDKAADALIHERAEQESINKSGVGKREMKYNAERDANYDTIYRLIHDENGNLLERRGTGKGQRTALGTYSVSKIAGECAISESAVNKIIAEIKADKRRSLAESGGAPHV